MPGLYRLSCESCDFSHEALESATFVRLADGAEELLPHPIERRRAKELTGQSWRRLRADGRILYRYAALCANCGTATYAPVTKIKGPHSWSITRNPVKEELTEPCPSCGEPTLCPLTDERLEREACPACGEGRLQVELVGRA